MVSKVITATSPLRLSLGGGGTDLASFYQAFGGEFLSAAINLKVTIQLQPKSMDVLEPLDKMSKVILSEYAIDKAPFAIDIHSDIPGGSGLGGSASFVTALIKAISTFKKESLSQEALAEKAYYLEHEKMGLSCGKQDQYSAVMAGLRWYQIDTCGKVCHRALKMSAEFLAFFQDNLLLVSTGIFRQSEQLLKNQQQKSLALDKAMIENLHEIKARGRLALDALESENFSAFSQQMKAHWQIKKARDKNITSPYINELYDYGLANGAMSGKLIGAGGGGFLLFCLADKKRLISALNLKKIPYYPIVITNEGTRVIH